ncbi:hypothetical protein DXG01_006452 [Tephrocybe rancida]|nr:hypothetical protein DXG01_006452 [Tephrocybe rancida]
MSGTFNVPDSTCGVPPCPDNMSWDYKYGMCMDCTWDGQTAPPDIGTEEALRSRMIGPEPKRGHPSEANTFEKRVGGCVPFNIPDGRTIAALVNNIQAWIDGRGAGPTVDQIVANDQLAWADTYPEPNRMREAGGYALACNLVSPAHLTPIKIAGSMQIPKNFFIQRQTTQLPPLVPINPRPTSSISINIAHPDLEPTPVPEGYVLVATFHTHPGVLIPQVEDPSLPSLFDNMNEWRRGVPGIIIHDRGLTAYGPSARAQMDPAGPQNFPMSNLDADNIATHFEDRGRRVGSWAPSCVPNQAEPPDAPSTSGCFGSGHTEL